MPRLARRRRTVGANRSRGCEAVSFWTRLLAVWLCVGALGSLAHAQICMVAPTDRQVVSGRFGKFRGGGASNHGSANTRPHMHDGLDFSTSNAAQPLFATTDGTITFMGPRGSAGNTVIIKRTNNDMVAYYHLSGFAKGLKVGVQVTAGQQIGLSGNTNRGNASSGNMAKHLHFVYGSGQRDQARAAAFPENAHKGPFNPGQLPSVFNRVQDVGWVTDPAPYFCQTFPIQDGHPEHVPILGGDTKAQHNLLFQNVTGGTGPGQGLDDVQIAAGNADARLATAAGVEPDQLVDDTQGFGGLPAPPLGLYDTMSPSEMLLTEASRRFNGADWATNITQLDERALWVDYVRMIGVSNYVGNAIYRKRERVEALLATYTANRLHGYKQQADEAAMQALKDRRRQQVQGF